MLKLFKLKPVAPLRSRLVSTSTASARDRKFQGLDDGILEEPTAVHRNAEINVFLRDLIQETEIAPSSLRYKSQTVIRPTDFHRDTRKRLELPHRRRPLPVYGALAKHDDPFLQLAIDPRREADNPRLLAGFLSSVGRILPRAMTGLSHRSHRLLGKAVKRSRMMGVIPLFSNPRHNIGPSSPNGSARRGAQNGKPKARHSY